ncbi:MAG TPA: PAS domain S-box protein [Bryobacteraceae bacterium]|nr:PAS domain S-box protein [Bryobacteraceae bacterium]
MNWRHVFDDTSTNIDRDLNGDSTARIADLEASVHRLEHRLSAYDRLLSQSPIPAIFYHADTLAIQQVNEGALSLYGHSREHFCSMTVRELFNPTTWMNIYDTEAEPQGEVWARELRKPINALGPCIQRGAGGRELVVRMTIFNFQFDGADGRLAIIQDETARQTTEEELRASEERYRELFENANDIIFLQDLNGRIKAANRAAEFLTGYSRTELLGQDFAQLLAPEARESMLDSIRAHLGGSPTQRYELPIHPKVGSARFLEVSTRIIYRRGHPFAIQGIGRDVTEWKISQRRLEETARELQLKNEELSKALRLAQEATQLKEQFLANTSHELRTPMNGIMGMTNLLKETDLDLDQRDYVDAVSQCANDLLTIINDLLDLSQIGAGKFSVSDESFEILDSVRSVIKLLRIRAGAKGLNLNYEIDSDLPVAIFGDSVRFRQILMNLVANAVKFTSHGGVEVRLRRLAGSILRCEVVDSGIGVEESIQEKIFQPFFQADGTLRRRYGGTGLGLTISKQLVEIMGGRIGVYNNTSMPGASFWFEIPLRSLPLATLS